MAPSKPKPRRDRRPLLMGALLVLLVVIAYLPALRGQFLWDDDDNVVNNHTLRSAEGLARIWFEPGATQQYYPLTHTSFWLDYHLWGLHSAGYHAINILLHAGSALLLWRILKRLAVPGAWFGAALFALHPTCVESVAWITERKNTLSGAFFLGAILASLRFWLPVQAPAAAKPKRRAKDEAISGHGPWGFYWLALFFYLCALWAKTAAVGLPAVIVLLLWWKRVKLSRREAILILPFLVAGAGMGLMTMWVEKTQVGAAGQEWHFTWPERCVIAGRALWFYLGKLVIPYPVEFMYPRWVIRASQPLAYAPLAAAVAGLLLLWRKREGWGRPLLFTAGFFIAMLFPVLGFFDVFFFKYSFVCDHFQYLASMAPLALAGAGLALAAGALVKGENFLKPVICGLPLLALGILTWQQTGVYRDIETLWRDTLAHNPDSWMAHDNLGKSLAEKGDSREAAQQFNEALRLKPDDASARNNLANVMLEDGKLDEAIAQINQALQFDRNFANAHYNLGLALDMKGDLAGAMREYNEAIRLKPNYAAAHNNLGNLLGRKGQVDEAMQQFTLALQLDPDYALAYNNLGYALASKGKLDEAIQAYIQALQINPDLADAHYNLGHARVGKGDFEKAIIEYQEALKLQPRNAQAHKSLGNVLAREGNIDEAARHYQMALEIQPGLADAHYNLGVIFARQGRIAEARSQFAEALRLKPDYDEAAKQLQALPR